MRVLDDVSGLRLEGVNAHHQNIDVAVEQRALGALFAGFGRFAAHADRLAAIVEQGLDDLPAASPPRLVERAVSERDADPHLFASRLRHADLISTGRAD